MIYSSVYLHTFIYIYSISINISWFSLWLVAVSHSFKSWHAGLKIHSNAGKLLRSPTFLYKTSHRQKTCDSDPKKGEDRRLKQHKHQEINNMYLSLCTVVRRHSSFFQRIRGIYIYIVLAMWGKNDWTKPFIPPVFSVNWSETVRRHCLKQLEAKGKKDSEHY